MADGVHDRGRQSEVGIKLCLSIGQHWGLSDNTLMQLLGESDQGIFDQWRAGDLVELSDDTFERSATLLGIHSCLRTLFTNPNNYYGWVKRDNQHFAGRSPLEYMLQNGLGGIKEVRQYLDSLTQGGGSK